MAGTYATKTMSINKQSTEVASNVHLVRVRNLMPEYRAELANHLENDAPELARDVMHGLAGAAPADGTRRDLVGDSFVDAAIMREGTIVGFIHGRTVSATSGHMFTLPFSEAARAKIAAVMSAREREQIDAQADELLLAGHHGIMLHMKQLGDVRSVHVFSPYRRQHIGTAALIALCDDAYAGEEDVIAWGLRGSESFVRSLGALVNPVSSHICIDGLYDGEFAITVFAATVRARAFTIADS